METPKQPTDRCLRIRQVMEEHVRSRLSHALSKLDGKKEDTDTKNKRQRAEQRFQLQRILEKGASAANGIAVASHIAKGVHPDLKVKKVSNLAVDLAKLPALEELGSHGLNANSSLFDTTGDGAYNTAAYDLYRLLDCTFEGIKLSRLLEEQDEDAIEAFQIEQADENFAEQCLALLKSKCISPAVHTQSKQIYWLKDGADAADDTGFEVLAPLFPAALAHQAYLQIHEHRFGETNKAARTARRERKAHDGVFHDYPGLAVQKMGGTKPQNISQLNSERSGVNYLLSSMPPQGWISSNIQLPMNTTSVFEKIFGARLQAYRTLRTLQDFLASNPPKNKATRVRFKELIEVLTQEVVIFAASYHETLPPGWTDDSENKFSSLNKYQQLWLDPMRASLGDTRPFIKKPSTTQNGKEPLREEMLSFAEAWQWMDWPAEIMKAFAQWLTHELGKGFGDPHMRQWRKELLASNLFRNQLRELREILKAPHYIPIRQTHDELVATRGASA